MTVAPKVASYIVSTSVTSRVSHGRIPHPFFMVLSALVPARSLNRLEGRYYTLFLAIVGLGLRHCHRKTSPFLNIL